MLKLTGYELCSLFSYQDYELAPYHVEKLDPQDFGSAPMVHIALYDRVEGLYYSLVSCSLEIRHIKQLIKLKLFTRTTREFWLKCKAIHVGAK